jgi:hypothetical protein
VEWKTQCSASCKEAYFIWRWSGLIVKPMLNPAGDSVVSLKSLAKRQKGRSARQFSRCEKKESMVGVMLMILMTTNQLILAPSPYLSGSALRGFYHQTLHWCAVLMTQLHIKLRSYWHPSLAKHA